MIGGATQRLSRRANATRTSLQLLRVLGRGGELLRAVGLAAVIGLSPHLVLAQSATLLPNGRQVFVDANGAPLAGGSVGFYVPNSLTPKTTWSDPNQSNPNTDPVGLDSSGSAVIYGAGQYREIVKDVNGTTIWDQLTYGASQVPLWGGTSAGTPNAQTLTASGWTQAAGQQVSFLVGAGLTNTGATTMAINGGTPLAVDLGTSALTGGELVAGAIITVGYNATAGVLQVLSFVPTAIANNSITNAKLAQMPTKTIKGNNTGATANPSDLTTSQVNSMLPVCVGDSGSGGTQGLVPAPPTGSAAAQKLLSAGCTWVAPGVGAVQTWQAVSRSIGTVYQNTESSPIQIAVTVAMSSNQNAELNIGPTSGVALEAEEVAAGGGAVIDAPMVAIIPPGWYYEVTATGATLVIWTELR